MSTRSLALAGLAASFVAASLVGCSESADLTPVPTEASGPYACDGVPERGPELILGGSAPVKSPERPGARVTDPLWQCTFDDGEGYLVVSDELLTASGDFGPDEESTLAFLRSVRGSQRVEADFPGEGYVTESVAAWVCEGRIVKVELIGEPIPERDVRQDVTNLLLSQLPFVCEGVEMPEAGDPGEG